MGTPVSRGSVASLGSDSSVPDIPSAAAVQEAAQEAVLAVVGEGEADEDSTELGAARGSKTTAKGVDVARVRRLSRFAGKPAKGGRRRRGGEPRPSIAVLARSRAAVAGGADEDPFAGNPTCGPWTRVRNEEGVIWYVNELTNEQRWAMPDSFDAPGAALWTPEMTAAAATNAAADAISSAKEEEAQTAAEDEAAPRLLRRKSSSGAGLADAGAASSSGRENPLASGRSRAKLLAGE